MIARQTREHAQASARIDVSAPGEREANRLVDALPGCHAQVVQVGRDEWVVRAQPWQEDSRTLNATLSAVERWLGAEGLCETTVVVGGRPFMLCAEPKTAVPLVVAAGA